jgi:hypothetical protein
MVFATMPIGLDFGATSNPIEIMDLKSDQVFYLAGFGRILSSSVVSG